jgi:3',5'-cyclic AMP phosphodiesterase CpdA
MEPQPNFVVASGDLTNMGDVASYELVRDLLAPLKPAVVMAMGNHDLREGFRAVFGGETGDAPYFHDAVQGGLHVITLDTKVPERVAGTICETQFAFLAVALKRRVELPKLIVMHHPPRVDDDGLAWGTIDLASTKQLTKTLKGHHVAGILSGHIHINQVHQWHGIPIIINSGLNYTIDLLERRDLRLLEGTTMTICEHRASGLSVNFVPLSPAQKDLGTIDRARLLAFT